MFEATVLYSVTAVVVAGLVVWVAFVLKTAKEPWARATPSATASIPADDASGHALAEQLRDAPRLPIDADSTARATPVALANDARARASSRPDDVVDASDASASKKTGL